MRRSRQVQCESQRDEACTEKAANVAQDGPPRYAAASRRDYERRAPKCLASRKSLSHPMGRRLGDGMQRQPRPRREGPTSQRARARQFQRRPPHQGTTRPGWRPPRPTGAKSRRKRRGGGGHLCWSTVCGQAWRSSTVNRRRSINPTRRASPDFARRPQPGRRNGSSSPLPP